jgi:hypothetical protein
MQNAGKLVVAGILVVAAVLATFAWWWNFRRGEQSRNFWGHEAAMLIRDAPQVELMRLEPVAGEASSGDSLAVGSERFTIVERKDISHAQGLLHARFALTEDASFEFNKPVTMEQPNWSFAVRFTAGKESATVVFDLDHSQVTLAETNRTARVIPKIVSGWRTFIARHFNTTSPPD